MNVTAVCFRFLSPRRSRRLLAESAAQLCAADKGLIFQRDGDVLRLVANLGYSR
jgi:hypothetical protein